MKKLVILLILALSVIGFSPAMGDDADEIKQLENPIGGGWIGVDFFDTVYDGTSLLTVFNNRTEENVDDWKTVICDSVADPKCQIPGYNIDALSIFSPCNEVITENCIESLGATLANGEKIVGTPGKLWNPNGVFKGDALKGIPDGGQPSTWTLKGSNPNGSEDYVLVAGVKGQMKVPDSSTAADNQNLFWGNIFANLQPVKYTQGNYQDPKMVLFPRGKTGIGTGGGLAINRGCFMNDSTQCALRATFPLDVTYTLKFRFSVRLASWLRGRLVDPVITTENSGSLKSTMTISAKAMSVPEVGGYIKWSDAPDWVKAKYPAGTGGTGTSPDAFTTQDLTTRILRVSSGSSGDRALKEFKEWIPFLLDKPMAMKTYWNVQSVQSSQKMNQCAHEKFAGYVASNSAIYSSGAPNWNEERQSLDYIVGAPHFDTQGNVLQGSYALGIKSDVARCLYGFTSAPISARVEIASEDGSPNIATTVINEDSASGMFTLTASGFHYSTPQLSVKLLQEKTPTPVATPSATPTPKAVAKVKSILCIKGKIKKTVKGTNPRCPTGYKKA